MAAGLLSLFPTYMKKGHHQTFGMWLLDQKWLYVVDKYSPIFISAFLISAETRVYQHRVCPTCQNLICAIIHSAGAAVGTPCRNASFVFHWFCFFSTFEHHGSENPMCSLTFESFFKEQALKPCSGPRSRDLLQTGPIESSGNLLVTDGVKTEGFQSANCRT